MLGIPLPHIPPSLSRSLTLGDSDLVLLVASAPIELVFAVVFLYQLLGWSSLVGVALMVASLIVPGLTAKVLARFQTNAR